MSYSESAHTDRPTPRGRQMAAVLAAVLVVAVGCAKKEAPAPPPTEVKIAPVIQKDVPIYVEAIGQTRGSTEIEVRARVEGFIQSIDFKEGNPVRKGQLLYTIDPQPFEAALAQAKGNLAETEAQLARATQDVVRFEPLVAKNAISRQEYETAVVVKRAAEAAVEASKAQAQRAEIDLGYTKVLAPEEGLAGKTEVYPGTLVGRGQSTLLTHISQIGHDPRPLHPPGTRLPLLRPPAAGAGQGRPDADAPHRAGARPTAPFTPRRGTSSSSTGTSTRPPGRS